MEAVIDKIMAQVGNIVIGKPQQVQLALTCILAKGHLLIEDLPGMGKTTLAHTLASSLGLRYQRMQFTNDMLPADIVGVSIFDNEKSSFMLHQGPIFNQVVLADEINRASPKTQSALLEAMEGGQVSIDGTTHELPNPFFVIATQNPQHHIGTYPLPESQLDRFMMKISLGFPDLKAEREILSANRKESGADLFASLTACITDEQLMSMQQEVMEVVVSDAIIDYVIALCRVTRRQQKLPTSSTLNFDEISPLSPRAAKALIAAAKAWAYIQKREYVLPDDIQAVFEPVCEHRLASIHDFSTHNANEPGVGIAKKILASVDVISPLT